MGWVVEEHQQVQRKLGLEDTGGEWKCQVLEV